MDMLNNTNHTIVLAAAGFEVLIIKKRGLLIEPIVAWAVETDATDVENVRHWVSPLTPEGDMKSVAGKLPWAIRRPGGVIEYGGQYFSRPIDFENAVARELAA